MKRLCTKTVLLAVLASFLFTGCFGKFELTRKLYGFNQSFGNKYVKSLVTWVLIWVQIHTIAALVDFGILNVIEFWTGSNPAAMNDDQKEEKIVIKDGQSYKITVTKNKMRVQKLDAKNPADVSLNYRPENKSWYVQNRNQTIKVATELDQNLVQIFNPDGSSFELNTVTGLAEGSIPALAMR
jgi:hypothetical protein